MTMSVTAPEQQFRDAIRSALGLDFADSRLEMLAELLERRAEAKGATTQAYIGTIGADPGELAELAEALTVGETYFFRHGEQFEALRQAVLPERMRVRGPVRLSVLSAGCASGEEAYTIAMVAAEMAPPAVIDIHGVDVNPAAVQRARAGRYGNWSLRDTPELVRRRWFTAHASGLSIAPELKQQVHFVRGNLVDAGNSVWQPAAYDVIFCRNVLMYFTPEQQRAVVARLAEALMPGGYLLLGHAETLRGLSEAFDLVHTNGAYYYRRKKGGRARVAASSASAAEPQVARAPASGVAWYEAIDRSSRRITDLASNAAPAGQPARQPLEVVLDLLQRERFADALTLIAELPPDAAADPAVRLVEALVLVLSGRQAAAQEICQLLLAREERNAGAYHVLGLCAEAAGDSERALTDYATAARLDPEFAMPRLRAGTLARRLGRLGEAREQLSRARALLTREDASRLLLFGGGFTRAALIAACEAELDASGGPA